MATEDDRHQRCAVDGCPSLKVKGGLCGKHYKEKFGVSAKKKCSEWGCDRIIYKGHMCFRHYQIAKKKLSPAPSPVPPPLLPTKKKSAGNIKCDAFGCDKWAVKDGLCIQHYKEKFGSSPKLRCTVDGCDRDRWKEGMCQRHLKQKQAGMVLVLKGDVLATMPEKAKAPKKTQRQAPAPTSRKESALRPFTYIYDFAELLSPGDGVIMGDDGKLHRLPAICPSPGAPCTSSSPVIASEARQSLSVASRKETIILKRPGVEDPRRAEITFTYRDGPPPEFNYSEVTGVAGPLTFDDWMFLGDVADEIKRIQEGGQ